MNQNHQRTNPKIPQAFLADINIQHPILNECVSQIVETTFSPDTRQTAFVIGPTGAGKTFAKSQIRAEIESRYEAEMKADPQFLPVVEFTAQMTSDKGFSWHSFYNQYLTALCCPFSSSRNLDEARDKIVKVTSQRRVKVVLIDEMHHLLHTGNKHTVFRQSETIKSLAQATGVKHVGFGTYDLLKIVRYNGQISRRTEVAHFIRYTANEADMKLFSQILAGLDEHPESPFTFKLSDHIQYFHSYSIGLVGALRDWLVYAHTIALTRGESGVSLERVREAALHVKERSVILREALDGEAEMAATKADLKYFETMIQTDSSGNRIEQFDLQLA